MKKTLIKNSYLAKQNVENQLKRIFEEGGFFEYKNTKVAWDEEKWKITDVLTGEEYIISFIDNAATFILSLNGMLHYEQEV